LYGNISGYIGFFLGYSLFQIPHFFCFLRRSLKQALKRFTKCCPNRVNLNKTSNQQCIMVEEQQQKVSEEEIRKFNLELYRLNQKFEEFDNIMRQ
jgi:hypothetical protein